MGTDPYAVLGVERGASLSEIKRAYRALARQWHPDRNPAPEAEGRFVEISAAFEVLSDPRRRAMHERDASRTHGEGPPLEFLQDFTDAVERAERMVEWAVARYRVRYWRGRGAELAARLAADLADGSALAAGEDPGWWARLRARRLLRRVEVDIDYRRSDAPSRVIQTRARWRIVLVPGAFWLSGVHEPERLDDLVALHLAGQVTAVLAHLGGVRALLLRGASGEFLVGKARSVDDAVVRKRRLDLALWAAVALLGAAMLFFGYRSRYG